MNINNQRREEIIEMRNNFLLNPPTNDYISTSTYYEFIDLVARKYTVYLHSTYLYAMYVKELNLWVAPIVFTFNDTMESVSLYVIRFFEGNNYYNDLILIESEFAEFQTNYLI